MLPGSGDLLVATSNGPFDGHTDWGDSVLRLDASARRLKAHWTPAQQRAYEEGDVDVGSTSPAFLGDGLVMQSGKDAKLHLLSLKPAARRPRRGGRPARRRPSGAADAGAPDDVHGAGRLAPRRAHDDDRHDRGRHRCLRVRDRELVRSWSTSHAGTSPVVAGGLLYVYDPTGGGLRILSPATGHAVARLHAGAGHWNSPVVADGHIVLGEGNANDHGTDGGILDIWSS